MNNVFEIIISVIGLGAVLYFFILAKEDYKYRDYNDTYKSDLKKWRKKKK